ncbi:MAG: YceI family protein [Deinococcales bacterium]|nr:YceI family protein [Chitinophagaceae bacterium]
MATYKIDVMHSDVTFKVKHLMISSVSGSFSTFDATLNSEKDDLSDASIIFSADIASITTGNEQRDEHLKGEDFFDATKYPKLSFASTAFIKVGDSDYELAGNLTIKDVTKPVVFAVEYGGTMTDFYGQFKAGFDISGKINRSEFGLTWSAITEAGGIVVSDEIKLNLSIQMIKQA